MAGRQRPLGIAAMEDKIVQQAVVTVLNQIYEEDFLTNVQIEHPAHLLPPQSHIQGVQRIMLAAPRPEPVGESQDFSITFRTNGW
jgi:hypothetical protein